MEIDARRDTIEVRVGSTFGRADAIRVQQAVATLGPFSRLVVDFHEVRECDDVALTRLARALAQVAYGEIAFHGLSHRQWRLLTYLGVNPEEPRDAAAGAADQ